MSGRPPRRRLAPLVSLLLLLILAVSATAAVSAAAPPVDRLPDLKVGPLRDMVIATTSSGRRLLRFSTTLVNSGAGAFELRADRPSTAARQMTVRQRIYNSDGGFRWLATKAAAGYSGDGHDHWHIDRVATYDLLPDGGGKALKVGAKVGFCFFDTTSVNRSLPYAAPSPVYRESGCGVPSSLYARMGISVGWGDKYQWSLAYQWIDVTGVPDGIYRVRVIVDGQNLYRETYEGNNCSYSRIQVSGSSVSVLGSGNSCLGWVPPATP